MASTPTTPTGVPAATSSTTLSKEEVAKARVTTINVYDLSDLHAMYQVLNNDEFDSLLSYCIVEKPEIFEESFFSRFTDEPSSSTAPEDSKEIHRADPTQMGTPNMSGPDASADDDRYTAMAQKLAVLQEENRALKVHNRHSESQLGLALAARQPTAKEEDEPTKPLTVAGRLQAYREERWYMTDPAKLKAGEERRAEEKARATNARCTEEEVKQLAEIKKVAQFALAKLKLAAEEESKLAEDVKVAEEDLGAIKQAAASEEKEIQALRASLYQLSADNKDLWDERSRIQEKQRLELVLATENPDFEAVGKTEG